jgi:hypothetical protein
MSLIPFLVYAGHVVIAGDRQTPPAGPEDAAVQAIWDQRLAEIVCWRARAAEWGPEMKSSFVFFLLVDKMIKILSVAGTAGAEEFMHRAESDGPAVQEEFAAFADVVEEEILSVVWRSVDRLAPAGLAITVPPCCGTGSTPMASCRIPGGAFLWTRSSLSQTGRRSGTSRTLSRATFGSPWKSISGTVGGASHRSVWGTIKGESIRCRARMMMIRDVELFPAIDDIDARGLPTSTMFNQLGALVVRIPASNSAPMDFSGMGIHFGSGRCITFQFAAGKGDGALGVNRDAGHSDCHLRPRRPDKCENADRSAGPECR